MQIQEIPRLDFDKILIALQPHTLTLQPLLVPAQLIQILLQAGDFFVSRSQRLKFRQQPQRQPTKQEEQTPHEGESADQRPTGAGLWRLVIQELGWLNCDQEKNRLMTEELMRLEASILDHQSAG
jgi:hypothetical protein